MLPPMPGYTYLFFGGAPALKSPSPLLRDSERELPGVVNDFYRKNTLPIFNHGSNLRRHPCPGRIQKCSVEAREVRERRSARAKPSIGISVGGSGKAVSGKWLGVIGFSGDRERV